MAGGRITRGIEFFSNEMWIIAWISKLIISKILTESEWKIIEFIKNVFIASIGFGSVVLPVLMVAVVWAEPEKGGIRSSNRKNGKTKNLSDFYSFCETFPT